MTTLDPKYAKAWSNKGVVLFSQGKYDESIKAFDEALKLDPNLVDAWYKKGVALKNRASTMKPSWLMTRQSS